MQKVKIEELDCLQKVLQVLKNGGVVMHPTETCYGLAVDVFSENALRKLYEVKEMSFDKPVSILVDSLEMAQQYGDFSEKALKCAEKYWPGPLSIIVPRKNNLPNFLNPGQDFISFRYSSYTFCNEMVKNFGRPVSTTSANKTGEPQFYLPKELSGVDLIVDGGEIPENKPSTIVKFDGDRLEILRQGDVRVEE